jgi:hypothetical protein
MTPIYSTLNPINREDDISHIYDTGSAIQTDINEIAKIKRTNIADIIEESETVNSKSIDLSPNTMKENAPILE